MVPLEVLNWMKFRMWGTIDPAILQEGKVKFLLRSSTLEVMKKAISWYMPDRVIVWSVRAKTGNPTRSKEINELIKYVKKAEVRRIGKHSNVKKPITMALFRMGLKLLEGKKRELTIIDTQQ